MGTKISLYLVKSIGLKDWKDHTTEVTPLLYSPNVPYLGLPV